MTVVDLSHQLSTETFHSKRFGPPDVRQVSTVADDGCSATVASFTVHCGTHVDAPSHLLEDGDPIDRVPLDRFHGPARVVQVSRKARDLVTDTDLEAALPDLEPDTIVCLATGWDEYFTEHETYRQYPYLDEAAGRWLVSQRVKMLALDTPSPDMPEGPRPPGFDWPVHRILLGAGVLIAEQLRGLTTLAGQRCRVYALPVIMRGADGAPARIFAEV